MLASCKKFLKNVKNWQIVMFLWYLKKSDWKSPFAYDVLDTTPWKKESEIKAMIIAF